MGTRTKVIIKSDLHKEVKPGLEFVALTKNLGTTKFVIESITPLTDKDFPIHLRTLSKYDSPNGRWMYSEETLGVSFNWFMQRVIFKVVEDE